MREYLAEVVGTFFLVFAGTGAIVANQVSGGDVTHPGIALTFGLVVLAMIYTIGDISGAHMNPAVTIAFWMGKRFPGKRVLPYLIAQLAGACLASGLLRLLFLEVSNVGMTLPSGPWWQSFVFEVILTFALMYVVLNVSTGSKEKGIMAGVAVGSTVGLEAMFAGPICGASMNPARSIAPAIFSAHLEHLWIYIVATILGALLALPVFELTKTDEQV